MFGKIDREGPYAGGYQTTAQPPPYKGTLAEGIARIHAEQLTRREDSVTYPAHMAPRPAEWDDDPDPEDYPVRQMNDEPVVVGAGAMNVLAAQVEDMVNSPGHYSAGAVEAIDAIRQALGAEGFIAFCQGNVLKYVWRARFKGSFEKDMAKAAWYARMAAGDDPRKS
jgi:hypothetical protein